MTEEEFLTLPLPERIQWLRSAEGPWGKLSHDRFAKALGTSRQVVIGWEKPNGPEPSERLRVKLADFSGFKPSAFSRREAEAATWESIGSRLAALEEVLVEQGRSTDRALRALTRAIERLERRLDDEGHQRTAEGSG